jgi:hypothetical protein
MYLFYTKRNEQSNKWRMQQNEAKDPTEDAIRLLEEIMRGQDVFFSAVPRQK